MSNRDKFKLSIVQWPQKRVFSYWFVYVVSKGQGWFALVKARTLHGHTYETFLELTYPDCVWAPAAALAVGGAAVMRPAEWLQD